MQRPIIIGSEDPDSGYVPASATPYNIYCHSEMMLFRVSPISGEFRQLTLLVKFSYVRFHFVGGFIIKETDRLA